MATQRSSPPISEEACELRTIHPIRVAATRARMLTARSAGRLAERFRLLGEPGRLRMVYALLEAGELCVCDLAAVVEATESSISHQLRQLRVAGLVKFRKEGRVVYYSVDDVHIRLLLDVAEQHYLHVDDGDSA